jgi:sugar phosphate isomerase/epimerase
MTSLIGFRTYAFFWQLSNRVSNPLDLHQALERPGALDVRAFQICDYAPLAAMNDGQLQSVRRTANSLEISQELGTKGIQPEHLRKFLHIAKVLGAPLLRTLLNAPAHTPTQRSRGNLHQGASRVRGGGVKVALETYEQVPTSRLLDVVRRVDSPFLGICSDPASTVAALELPRKSSRQSPHTS